jgi:hypothetical protein
MSTAFHPQTDGQTERQNQTLEYYLRAYINHHQDDWMRWLPYAQFVYNNSEHSVLGITPTQALMGFTPELRIDIPRNTDDLNPNAVERVQDLRAMREFLASQLEAAKAAMKRYHNRNRLDTTFRVGQWVMLRMKNIDTGRRTNTAIYNDNGIRHPSNERPAPTSQTTAGDDDGQNK